MRNQAVASHSGIENLLTVYMNLGNGKWNEYANQSLVKRMHEWDVKELYLGNPLSMQATIKKDKFLRKSPMSASIR